MLQMVIVNIVNGGSIVLILATIFSTNIRGEDNIQDMNRTCIPAEAEPTLNSSSCHPLVNFTRPFCQNQGIILDKYIFRTRLDQIRNNEEGNINYDGLLGKLGESFISRIFNLTISKECIRPLVVAYCHYLFPRCDRTRSVFQEQRICRETCRKIFKMCGSWYKVIKKFYLIRVPEDRKLANCELQPYRNAGDSPECWHYNELAGTLATADRITAGERHDCLHLNGSSYHGNISVTSSGITCQSWREQCPHRHTMNTTYPELNLAKNHCRNSQNSGQRPWCFTTDRNKRWEYCDIPKCIPVDGNYGNWSLSSTCNVTCDRGFETWRRECDNPKPKFGGKACSHLGDTVEHRPCIATKHCPVSGGYSNWSLSIPCNVTCGEGVEIWRRTCNNPVPNYGGRNCSKLGDWTEFRNCSRKPCPIDGNYGNWTKSSPCSVTCGEGVEIRTRECDNPPGKYGGNCSKQGEPHKIQTCEMVSCPVVFDSSKMIGITVGAVVVFVLVVAVVAFCFTLRRRRRKQGVFCYPLVPPQYLNTPEDDNEISINATYQNVTSEGDPVPVLSRGIVRYRRDYMNTRPCRIAWYDKLQLIRPIAMEWLRNAWGDVDEFGRHVYDIMQRDRHVSSPYDKLRKISLDDSSGSEIEFDSEIYNTFERTPAVLLPTGNDNMQAADIA